MVSDFQYLNFLTNNFKFQKVYFVVHRWDVYQIIVNCLIPLDTLRRLKTSKIIFTVLKRFLIHIAQKRVKILLQIKIDGNNRV